MQDGKRTIKYFIFSLLFMLFVNRFVYDFGRLLAQGRFHHDMTLPADAFFPFLPWSIIIYFGCFLFWTAIFYFVARLPRRDSGRFFCADIMAKIVCLLFFVFYPTTNIRPEITGTTVWDTIMRWLYQIDAPDNLFPSIHCMVSWLCWVGVRGKKGVPVFWRIAAFVMAVAVCVSTFTTRQHVILDALGGIVLAEICYLIAGAEKLRNRYASFADGVLDKLEKWLEKRKARVSQ